MTSMGYDLLILETAVDYWPQLEPRFHLVCRIWSMSDNDMIGLRVPLNGNNPSSPSLTAIYPAAGWYEREVWDMFGIKFEGHPDLRRLIMPFDWEGHPLRKDYPLGYEEVQFTFNFDKVAAQEAASQGIDPLNGKPMPDYREVTLDDLRNLVSDRALTGETVLLNMGPQHPSTHGVLRLLLELDGEIVSTVFRILASCTPVWKRTWRQRPTRKPR